eukprot:CAMPEP_0117867680 /NCGR_PEP_ID=MMETSP0950-20121206/8134_1 /TAXON_ID=44440 /ORGANISM="Chattonella subsalsa, Strain CCMP2191" /LENGTH=107 /DNA_ID=CAMNT_0005719313 /DNA_START=324 /DNA_END=647 /DNA_ORIENTATION=+
MASNNNPRCFSKGFSSCNQDHHFNLGNQPHSSMGKRVPCNMGKWAHFSMGIKALSSMGRHPHSNMGKQAHFNMSNQPFNMGNQDHSNKARASCTKLKQHTKTCKACK